MTREELMTRQTGLLHQKAQAQTQRDHAQRLMDTCEGAIQECAYWLQTLAEQEQAEQAERTNGAVKKGKAKVG